MSTPQQPPKTQLVVPQSTLLRALAERRRALEAERTSHRAALADLVLRREEIEREIAVGREVIARVEGQLEENANFAGQLQSLRAEQPQASQAAEPAAPPDGGGNSSQDAQPQNTGEPKQEG
jgi:chromosome segregation ATPase